MHAYIQRLEDLEKLTMKFKGVEKTYAMQAGRELRIIVDAEEVQDNHINSLCLDISQEIEKEIQYPGQIKVTVIREKRATSYAK